MSRITRKPPPPIEDSVEQFKFDIEEYLSKSPITNKFREENPNLQPTTSNDMVEPTGSTGIMEYGSLDPSIASTNKSVYSGSASPLQRSPRSFNNESEASIAEDVSSNTTAEISDGNSKPERSHSNSITSSTDGTAFKTDPLEPEIVPLQRTESRLSKFKRFSLNKLDLGKSQKFVPTHKKYNSVNSPNGRLSISTPVLNADNTFVPSPNRARLDSGSVSRNSMLSSIKRNSKVFTPQMKYSASNQSLQSVTTTNTQSTTDTLTPDCLEEKISTPYWKYHVLKFGKDLYVTTNPSAKHVYCRNGPGYYIEITRDLDQNNGDDGFTMIFKDAETQSNKLKPPIMLIHKRAKKDGGYFTVSLTRSSQLKKQMIKYGNELEKEKRNLFNGLSMPQTIPDQFIPYDKISNTKSFEHHEVNFKNYEFRDFNNIKWNVGSIPRVRTSKLNKFRNKLNENGNSSDPEEAEAWKFLGKQNIYFHQNYIDSNQIMPFKSNNPRDVYLQTSDKNSFPPVLCMFRPYKKKFGSKMKNSFNKRLSKSYGNNGQATNNGTGNNNDYANLGDMTKINNKQLDYDIAGGEHKNYYIAGDGLYYHRSPTDDLPDENKLGWVTIYEDKILQEKGMFDLVLGLTLAIGYENCQSK